MAQWMRKLGAGVVAMALGAAAGAASAQQVAVDTGQLAGTTTAGVSAYKGIPFAAPPVGPLRWRPPQPAAPWKGVRDASAFGHSCLQPASRWSTVKDLSEDCLYLNVWAPAHATKPLPVMVWVHGGGYVIGSGASRIYDGSRFAQDGVVLVTLNYRLGALGFLADPALTQEAAPDAPLGNYGLMDQVAALQWVQRNIARFGGDPANVTVFGESAGAGSVLYLLGTDATRGLYQKAIIESGPGFAPPSSLGVKETQGRAFLKKAGAPDNATAEQLRAIPAEALTAPGEGVDWQPFADGRFIKAPFELAFASGRTPAIPLMIGTNTDDGSLAGPEGYPGVPKLLWGLMGPRGETLRGIYASEGITGEAQDRTVFNDFVFGAPARWIAAQSAVRQPVYLYRFGYVPEGLRGQVTGAPHAGELAFVFDTLDKDVRLHTPPTSQDLAEAAFVHSCWVSFAKTGQPVCTGGPAWPAYQSAADPLYLFKETGGAQVAAGYRKAPNDFVIGLVGGMFGGGRR